MAKNPTQKQAPPTKKHLARVERERRQTRMIVIGSILVIVAVVAVVGYGILDQTYLRGLRPVAVVNGARITGNDFQNYVRYYRSQLIRQAEQTYQFAQIFGSDPNTMSSFAGQLQSIVRQLDVDTAGDSAINELVDNKLIEQEAAKRGISASPEEIEERMQQAFGYYAKGTPTARPTQPALPTSTLSPLQMEWAPPTETPFPTPVITATTAITSETPVTETAATATPAEPTAPAETPTPFPTATPYTFEAYQQNYATQIADYEANLSIPEKTLRDVIKIVILREKLLKEVVGEVACTQERTWAQHILVEDEALAKDLLERIQNGEDWGKLASEYSIDTSNKDRNGDLGWFPRGQMVPEFEDVAFRLPVGQVSDPVKTQFGYHIIRVLGREEQPLSLSECDQKKVEEFSTWLATVRQNSTITINREFWETIVPIAPTLAPEIRQFANSASGAPAGFPQP